jgi:acetyl-CoA carboxylase biotin carboxyl carrier protein
MKDELILTLIDKLETSGLAELDYSDGASRLVLRKSVAPILLQGDAYGNSTYSNAAYAGQGAGANTGAGGSSANAGQNAANTSGTNAGQNANTGNSVGASTNAPVNVAGDVIISPIVGTFYPSPSSDSPPFVRAGSKVKAGDTLCILEAMKMMNQLEAEFDCEIIAVKAAGGDLVEYGQILFEVKKL